MHRGALEQGPLKGRGFSSTLLFAGKCRHAVWQLAVTHRRLMFHWRRLAVNQRLASAGSWRGDYLCTAHVEPTAAAGPFNRIILRFSRKKCFMVKR